MADSAEYVPPTGEEPTEYGTLRRPTSNLSDDLNTTIIANLVDGIYAAWNGWDQAAKFQDEGLMAYYMKYIHVLNTTLEKVKKF